jgi:hypothetical protein
MKPDLPSIYTLSGPTNSTRVPVTALKPTDLTNSDQLAVNRPETENVETPKSVKKAGVSVPAMAIIDNCVPVNRTSHEQLFALKLASHSYRVDLGFHTFEVSVRTVPAL